MLSELLTFRVFDRSKNDIKIDLRNEKDVSRKCETYSIHKSKSETSSLEIDVVKNF